MDFKHELKLDSLKKKLNEERETDQINLDSFLKKHRSHSAPRRLAGIEKSVSFEPMNLMPERVQASMLKRRSRKRSEEEDEEVDMMKVNMPKEPKEPKESLFRDRSPIKGRLRLAETGKKVINMMRALELSDGPKPDTEKIEKAPEPTETRPNTPTPPAELSLHSQMKAYLPKLIPEGDHETNETAMEGLEQGAVGGDDPGKSVYQSEGAPAETEKPRMDLKAFNDLISESDTIIKDQNEKIQNLKRMVFDLEDENKICKERTERERSNLERVQNQYALEIGNRDQEIAELEKAYLLSSQNAKKVPELKNTLDFALSMRREIEEQNVSLKQEVEKLMEQHKNDMIAAEHMEKQFNRWKAENFTKEINNKRDSDEREKKLITELDELHAQYNHIIGLQDRIKQVVHDGKQNMHVNPRSGGNNPGPKGPPTSGSVLALDNPDDEEILNDHVDNHMRVNANARPRMDMVKYSKQIIWPTTDTSHFASMVAAQIVVSQRLECPDELLAQSLHNYLIRDNTVKEFYVNEVKTKQIDISSLGQIVSILGNLDPLHNHLSPEGRLKLCRPNTRNEEMAYAYAIRLKAKADELFPGETAKIITNRIKDQFFLAFEYKGLRFSENDENILRQNPDFDVMVTEAQRIIDRKVRRNSQGRQPARVQPSFQPQRERPQINAIERQPVTGFQSYESRTAGGGGTSEPQGPSIAPNLAKMACPQNERATEEQFYTGLDNAGNAMVICFKCGSFNGHKAGSCPYYPYCYICKVPSPRHSTKHCRNKGQSGQAGQAPERESFSNM